MATTPSSSDTLRRYFEAYNARDAEAIGRLVTDTVTLSRPGQNVVGPDRKAKVLRVLAGEGNWFGVEELWTGTNTGGDEMFGPPGAKIAIYAFTVYEVRDGKFARSVAWTGRPASPEVLQ